MIRPGIKPDAGAVWDRASPLQQEGEEIQSQQQLSHPAGVLQDNAEFARGKDPFRSPLSVTKWTIWFNRGVPRVHAVGV